MGSSHDKGKRGKRLGAECWQTANYVDQKMARAMAHPMRVQILAELNQRVMSPSEFSRHFNRTLTNVCYHFRVLRELGCLEEVETRPVRGSTEHFYAATKRALFDGKPWEALPESLRLAVSGQVMGDFLGAVAMAMTAGTFDTKKDRVAFWEQRQLDHQGWEEAVRAHRKLIEKMDEIYKGVDRRLAETDEPDEAMLSTYWHDPLKSVRPL